MKSRRLLILWLVALASLIAWRAFSLQTQTQRTSDARRTLATAQSAADQIRRFAPHPATSLDPRTTDAQLLSNVEESLTRAGVSASMVRDLSIDARADTLTTSGQDLIRRSGRFSLESTPLSLIGTALNALREDLPPLRIETISLQRTSPPDTLPSFFRVTVAFVGYSAPLSSIAPVSPRPVTPPPSPPSAARQVKPQ
jgi:hypothetical protein